MSAYASADLDKLLGEPVMADTSAGDVPVYAMRLGQLATVTRLCKPMFGQLLAMGDGDAVDEAAIMDLLADNGDTVVDLLGVLVEMPRDQVEQLPLDDTLALLAAVVEANRDFFTRRVWPKLADQFPTLTRGLSPSTGRLNARAASAKPAARGQPSPPN